MLATIAWLLLGQWYEWDVGLMGYSLILPFLIILVVMFYLLAKVWPRRELAHHATMNRTARRGF